MLPIGLSEPSAAILYSKITRPMKSATYANVPVGSMATMHGFMPAETVLTSVKSPSAPILYELTVPGSSCAGTSANRPSGVKANGYGVRTGPGDAIGFGFNLPLLMVKRWNVPGFGYGATLRA